MSYCNIGKPVSKNYAPPIMGNGEIATCLDYEGVHNFYAEFEPHKTDIPKCEIWWAGRRYMDTFNRELIPFGQIKQKLTVDGLTVQDPVSWRQELNNKNGLISCDCLYENEINIQTEAFVHYGCNVIAVRKRFLPGKSGEYEFIYKLCNQNGGKIRRFQYNCIQEKNGVAIHYTADGQESYVGVIRVFADKNVNIRLVDDSICLSAEVKNNDEFAYFISFHDDAACEGTSKALRSKIEKTGFDGMFSESKALWDSYMSESYVEIDDEAVQDAYQTAQYNLKVYTTPWSIPIGINDLLWQGRYFGFDEYFSFTALMTSNHTELAKRVPVFRKNGLKRATDRASSFNVNQARYPWEAVENGEEGSPMGFWYDHIFHMANIALESWEYYLYTNDFDFLKNVSYDVIKACASFFLESMVYKFDDNVIIGKCSDLERLGASRLNPYMSSCSAIKTLQTMSKAAKVMQMDEELAAECDKAAEGLLKSLPDNGERYVPYQGCEQRSIAVFAGLYPYKVIENDNKLQLNAMEDYVKYEKQYGNMYAYGNSVSSWYASWKSLAYSRIARAEEAFKALKQVVSSCGCFGEVAEINEPGIIIKPWFTTASGAMIEALNEAIIQSDEDEVRLFMGLDKEHKNVSARLLTVNGVMVDVRLVDDEIQSLHFKKNEYCKRDRLTIRLNRRFDTDKISDAAYFYEEDGDWKILKYAI